MALADTVFYENIMEGEAAWLAKIQLPGGAIPMSDKHLESAGYQYKVVPYFSNLAAEGWLERPTYATGVRKYMDWYFEHLNWPDYNGVYGTIYDYYISSDKTTETATKKYDSTDSYAATFLSLLRKYFEKTEDYAYLSGHKHEIDAIGNVMIHTMDRDGLTWAKPDYKVKYLMDNCEVYRGLDDAQWIFKNVFGDLKGSEYYRSYKTKVLKGIEKSLWNSPFYHDCKYIFGFMGKTNFKKFYPDAVCQLYPIWNGILEAKELRAINLYETFNKHYPGWTALDTGDVFPWTFAAYTASMMGDKGRVDSFLQTVKKKYLDSTHSWPWYCLESGVTMLTIARMQGLK
ncbi:MAG: hypothetical protein N2645_24085 [Clostridia bacterium]|nr:hypothetical protein [Clostridia bacterium]